MPEPTLQTARLVLRPPVAADLDGWQEFCADEATMRFLGGVQPRSGAWHELALMAGTWNLHGYGMFSVIEKTSGRWIGRIGPWHPEGWPGTEVGWGLLPCARGRGYAVEAAAAAMDWAIDNAAWTDIIHVIDPDNTGSAGVAKRLGSTRRGPGRLPVPYQDARVDVWGQTAAEWKINRRAIEQAVIT